MKLCDQDILTDVLTSQKNITGNYNTIANEASEASVRNTLMNILDDEHNIQFDVFKEMSKRGWYQTENAPQDKINQVKQKFPAGNCNSCIG